MFRAVLIRSDCTGVNMQRSMLIGSALEEIDFSRATLSNTDFSWADLEGVNFHDVLIEESDRSLFHGTKNIPSSLYDLSGTN